jgi:heme-degrading monooxygenase HmoA
VVVFEVTMKPGLLQQYLDLAASLRPELEKIDGFISVERFESLANEGKYVSISFWRDEDAVARWHAHAEHNLAQERGKNEIFADFRISICEVGRQYTMAERV